MDWRRVLERYGPLAAIAVILTLWLTGSVSSDLRAVKTMLEYHIYRTDHILYAICINAAKDGGQRELCNDTPRLR